MRVEVYGCKGNSAFSSPKSAYDFLAEPPSYASEIGTSGHKIETARPRRLDQTVSKYTKIFVPTLTTARAKKLRRQWSTR